MEVVAECVEKEEQADLLRTLGCDQGQGFYFARPLDASSFTQKLQSHRLWGHDPLPMATTRQPESILRQPHRANLLRAHRS